MGPRKARPDEKLRAVSNHGDALEPAAASKTLAITGRRRT